MSEPWLKMPDDRIIDEIAPFVARSVREGIDAQGGKNAQPIWRPADVLVEAGPGAATEIHVDGDQAGVRTAAINGSSVLIVPGHRVLALLVEPHGIWVQGVIGTDASAPYIGAYRERALAGTFVSTITPATMTMANPDVEYDPYGYWSSNTVITIPSGLDGRYLICAHVRIAFDNDGGRRILIAKNGVATYWDTNYGPPTVAVAARCEVVGTLDLITNDTIEIQVAQNSGSTLDVDERIVSIDLLAPL